MHLRYIEDIVAQIFFIVPLFTKKGTVMPIPFLADTGALITLYNSRMKLK